MPEETHDKKIYEYVIDNTTIHKTIYTLDTLSEEEIFEALTVLGGEDRVEEETD